MSMSTLCLPVQSELRLVEDELAKSSLSEVELVSAAAGYVLQNGGKRIRPALLLLTARALGFPAAAAAPFAAAIEMIHAASLMHDDVLDNASLRRGKSSANAKWGNQISILVGDFLWCRASQIVIKGGNAKILSVITNAVEKTTEGEILEIVRSSDFNIAQDDYLKVIKLKTAVLFACACRVGAILAQAPSTFEDAAHEFGMNLGMAFQLADDVLDYTSDEEKFGKKVGTDLCGGKLTLPLIVALKNCRADEAQLIKEALLSPVFDVERFGQIKTILRNCGAIPLSLEVAKGFVARAKEALTPLKTSLEKDSLLAIADYSISRGD